jgi:Amt family ammonium transporter
MFGVHCLGGVVGALQKGVSPSPRVGGTGVYDDVANKAGGYMWPIG